MLTLEEKTFRTRLLSSLNKLIETQEKLITKIDELNENLKQCNQGCSEI
jgi:hypothetical protein